MSNNFQNNSVQDESTPSKPTETSLCKNCFEFFGNPAHDNLCSACYKNCQKPLNVTPARPLQVQSIIAEIAQAQENKIEEKIVVEKKEPEPAKQVSSSKCLKCKKKVGLLGYDCKCGSTFCKLHRLPEDHDCEFDFCSKEREKLRKANPIVTASKLVKF